jgi:hypothetical protein
MALFDVNSLLSGAIAADGTRSAQAITATAISTNVIDLRQPRGTPALKDEGIVGQEIWLNVQVIQAFNTLTSLTITLETDSTANLATSPTVHFSKSVVLANLTAGSTAVRVQLPSEFTYERYMGVRYTVVGANPTLGSVIAYLSLDAPANAGYPGAFTLDV